MKEVTYIVKEGATTRSQGTIRVPLVMPNDALEAILLQATANAYKGVVGDYTVTFS